MQSADLIRRAAGVDDRVGRGSSRWCFGRYICVDCPRDHHLPPFLPFFLPIHIREHRARYPHHAIRWWCWDHCQLEPEGGDVVTQPYPADQVSIGACLTCMAVVLVTPGNENHLICGQPIAYTIPFTASGGVDIAPSPPDDELPAPPETPSLFYVTCPSCQASLNLSISEAEITLTLPSPGDPAADADDSPPWDEPSAPPPAPTPDGAADESPATVGAETDGPSEPSPPDPDREGP